MRRSGIARALLLGTVMASTTALAEEERADPNQPTASTEQPGTPGRIAQGVSGMVTDRGGAPVAGARVDAISLDEPRRPVPDIAILSDARGEFTWPLAPGRYRLTVKAGAQELATVVIEVVAGAVTRLRLVAER